jgi:acyl carrier protein
MYRTGDRARVSPDGTLEFLGRSDHQVKVRGVRVELGELEAALSAEPGVREAVALVRGLNDAQALVAYVAGGGASLDGRALRERMRAQLPVQLVPAQVLVLNALPRTASGKLDRGALEAMPLARRAHRPPESETAKRLAALFEELLGAPRLGLDDEFFELGGDSLLAMRLCARVKRELDADLTLPALFEAPSIGALAERIEQLAPSAAVQDSIADALAELRDLDPEALSALLQTTDREPA